MQLYANSIVLFCYTSIILYYSAISISRSYCLHSNKEVSFWLHEANRIYYLNGPVYQNIFITLFSLLKFDIFNLLWIQKKIIFDYMKLFEFIPWMRVYRSIFKFYWIFFITVISSNGTIYSHFICNKNSYGSYLISLILFIQLLLHFINKIEFANHQGQFQLQTQQTTF